MKRLVKVGLVALAIPATLIGFGVWLLIADPRVELVRSAVRSCRVATVVESPASIPVLEIFLEKYSSVISVTGLLNRLLYPIGFPILLASVSSTLRMRSTI